MSSIEESVREIQEVFCFFEDPMQKIEQLIDYGKMASGISEDLKIDDNMSVVSFLGFSPNCISQINPRHYNPTLEVPTLDFICEEGIEPSIGLKNIESDELFDYNPSVEYSPGLYFLTFQYDNPDLYLASGVSLAIAFNDRLWIEPMIKFNIPGEEYGLESQRSLNLAWAFRYTF